MGFSKFCEILRGTMPDQTVVIRPNSRLVDDLCLCSFDMMVVLDEIERTTNTSVCLDNLISVKTVQDLYEAFFKGGEKNG